MHPLLTLSETAKVFADARGGDADDAKLFLAQLRHLDTTRQIKADARHRDARGTVQFSHREVALARVLIAATDQNFTRRDLQWLRVVLDRGRTVSLPLGDLDIKIDTVVRGLETENWALEIATSRGMDVEQRRLNASMVKLMADGSVERFDAPDPFEGDAAESVTYIMLSNILRPVFERLQD